MAPLLLGWIMGVSFLATSLDPDVWQAPVLPRLLPAHGHLQAPRTAPENWFKGIYYWGQSEGNLSPFGGPFLGLKGF